MIYRLSLNSLISFSSLQFSLFISSKSHHLTQSYFHKSKKNDVKKQFTCWFTVKRILIGLFTAANMCYTFGLRAHHSLQQLSIDIMESKEKTYSTYKSYRVTVNLRSASAGSGRREGGGVEALGCRTVQQIKREYFKDSCLECVCQFCSS